jgi:hypothetical protein
MGDALRHERERGVTLGKSIGYWRAAVWLLKTHPQRDAVPLLLAQARSEAESLALLEPSPDAVFFGVTQALDELLAAARA